MNSNQNNGNKREPSRRAAVKRSSLERSVLVCDLSDAYLDPVSYTHLTLPTKA